MTWLAEWDSQAVFPERPCCMECGSDNHDAYELLWTGNSESFHGYEIWTYCRACKVDTFHKIDQKAEVSGDDPT